MSKQLIVNADDYGLSAGVSAGIRQAHREGIVTSTTVLMNYPAAAEALRQALAETPTLDLGVHLVLTEGIPVLPPEQIPSLVAHGINGEFTSLLDWLEHAGELNPAEVRAEWQAQIRAFIQITGRQPSHLDSHHHAAFYTPTLCKILLELAAEYGAAVRYPIALTVGQAQYWGAPWQESWDKTVAPELHALFADATLRYPPRFEARFYDPTDALAELHAVLAELPDGVTELMCHPAHVDAELVSLTSYHAPRAGELKALTAPEIRATLQAAGVELIDFTAL